MTLDHFAIKDVLCYDSITKQTLTAGERIAIHQYLGLNKPVNESLHLKIVNLYKIIEHHKWMRPVVKYNDDYRLEIIYQYQN